MGIVFGTTSTRLVSYCFALKMILFCILVDLLDLIVYYLTYKKQLLDLIKKAEGEKV